MFGVNKTVASNPNVRQWDWFDYVLHTPSTHPAYPTAMRMQNSGFSLEDARYAFLSPEKKARQLETLSQIEGSPVVQGTFWSNLQMRFVNALFDAGLSGENAAAWTRIALSEDLAISQTVALAELGEVDPLKLVKLVEDTRQAEGHRKWDFDTLYNAILNDIDLDMMGELYAGVSALDTPDVISVNILDSHGFLEASIIGSGFQLSRRRVLKELRTDRFFYEINVDGTNFERQIDKENPYDYRARALRKEVFDIIREHAKIQLDDYRVNFRYNIDMGH